MIRGFIVGVIATIVFAAAVIYAIVATGTIPAGTAGGPVPFEKQIARTSLRATLDRESPKGDGPLKATPANLIEGIKLYGPRCAVCHGLADGQPTSINKGEYPQPPLLAKEGVEDDPVGWTFWKVKNGIRWTGMPAWNEELNDQQIWKLALFLKHMDKLPPEAQTAWKALQMPGEAPPVPAKPQNPALPGGEDTGAAPSQH